MHKIYGDVYSTLTFGGTYKTAMRRDRDDQPYLQAEEIGSSRKKGIRAGKPSSRTGTWVGRLAVVPLALVAGAVAISNGIGEAATKLYVDPFVRKENSRNDAGGDL
ncbi:MAG: hypothetical protein KDE08_15805 [Rhodobacteraceae bacterium]|nr:hypothetical protein [Paracoccaceae bacterium]